MSEFLVEAANDYLSGQADPEEVELDGHAGKRIFKGNELYWEQDRDHEMGVFLTAKNAIAYWWLCPRAANDYDRERFEVYENLDELFERQTWLEERKNRQIKDAIQREHAELTGRRNTERLDI